MQVLHRVNRAFLRPSEINSQMISDVIIENEIYLLQEYFYPLHRFTRPQKILKEFFGWFTGPPPHGQSPWGGIFAKPDKVRKQFVILSEVEKKSPKAISVDLGLAKTNLLARMRAPDIKYAWIHARETLAFDCVRLLMWGCHNVISLRSGYSEH